MQTTTWTSTNGKRLGALVGVGGREGEDTITLHCRRNITKVYNYYTKRKLCSCETVQYHYKKFFFIYCYTTLFVSM